MSQPLTLFTLMGVASASEAAQRWPREPFLPGLGLTAGGEDPSDYEPLLAYLNRVLRFAAVRPGSAADRVGIAAELVIDPDPNPQPLVLRQLPDIAFVLQPNIADRPARLFATRSDAGVEAVVEGLPVEIILPNGLLMPLRSEEDELAGPSLTHVRQAGPFQPGAYDTFEIVLRELTSSSLFVHIRVRLTEEGEVVVEPAVPISIGPCRFSGLPCRGVHDFGFLPYPTLSGAHTEHEQALEWARHEIAGGLGIDGTGLLTVRTLDLDHARDPLKQLIERFADSGQAANLEFVLEDLALPVSAWLTPVPTHGRFGLRRAVLQGGGEAEAYDLTLAPVEIDLSKVVDWRLKIFRLLFETPATAVARMAVLFGDSPEEDHALVIDVTDGWLLQGAWLPPDPIHAFTLANVSVSLMTAKLGILLRDIQDAQGVEGWFDHLRALIDIGVKVGDGKDEVVQASVPGKPPGADLGVDLVLRNIGWDLGEEAIIPSLWFPETLKLTAFEVVQLQVEEVAFVSEANGGRYLAFSGGISIFPGVGQPERKTTTPGTPGVPAENQPSGGGLRFRRLRLRIGGNELAPRWLLDGISLFIKVGTFELSGSGSITDVTRDAHRYREFALGLLLRFEAMKKQFSIGAQLVYGRVTGPVDRFTYWLFGLQLSYCPVGTFELRGIRMLVAGGMSPNLPEPSGRPQEMRLLDWYKQFSASGAVEVRSDRSQQRGGWKVEQGAQAAGVGADLGLSSCRTFFLRCFIFFHRSDSQSGLLVAAEVFALNKATRIGIGAIEVDLDRDRWSALIGVDIELSKMLGTESPLPKGLPRLTGTIFAGNQPAMFAIGQLTDQTSWLTLSVNKSLLGMQARVSVAFCMQVAAGDGPRGAGLCVTAAAEGSMGIGKVQFYASFGLLVGVWGNEASSSGFIAWAEVALRIKVFWVFSFGAHVKAIFEQLGPQEPNYRRVSLEVRIETPWWLPDVTFRVERVRDTPQPEAMPVLSAPLSTVGALEPGAATETAIAMTTLGDAGSVHTIAELRVLPAAPIAESVWAELVPVSVDSTIVLNFSVSVGNETTVVPSTDAAAGQQAATAPAQNQLSSTYTITQIGIRRRPRFGPDAGVWTDLLAPADSEIGDLDALLDDLDLGVTFASTVKFRWDDDVIIDNRVDNRRLLANADTPFTFLTGNPAADEGLLATDPSFPCCSGKRRTVSHMLNFASVALGVRAPVVQRFSESTSTLRWLLLQPPVVVAAVGQPSGVPVARVLISSSTDLAIAVVTFDEPAFLFDMSTFWTPVHVPELGSALVVEACRGLEVASRQVFPLSTPSPAVPIRCLDPRGLTSVMLRYRRATGDGGTTAPSGEWLEIRNMRYLTVREERDRIADQGRCAAQGGVAGGGKLAWLPNHDYELTLTVRATVDYQGSAQEAVVVQRAGFRTRGLPGLNAVDSPGLELEPYVESIYPGSTGVLYRREPIVLAFDERFSTLLPVDRTPAPDDPAERTQLLEWVLAVEQADGQQVSVATADWIVDHRGTAPPPRRWVPRVIDDVLVRTEVRHAPTIAPLVQRLEALELLSPSCDQNDVRLHASQILTHNPLDPGAADPAVPLWPPRTTLRVAVRAKAGAHVSRRPFEDGDETALTVADEGRITATPWRVSDGALAVSGTAAVGVRHYAVMGEPDWDHLQIHAEVDPAAGAAGIAVAVSGLPRVDRALLALVDAVSGRLRLLARRGGATEDLASKPLPAGSAAPYALEVLVFDDRVRARVGEVSVETVRSDLRDGRVAVVIDGPGRCSALQIDGLDAHISQLITSRFADFDAHIASWDRMLRPLPADAGAVSALRAATSAEIVAAMTSEADPQVRQRLFDRWIAELAIPLSPAVDGLRLGVVGDAAGTRLLVLESPEPLPLGRDVRLTVTHRVTAMPDTPPSVPRAWVRFAAGLTFARTIVRGPVLDDILAEVRRARTLVHAVRGDRLSRRVEYRIYRVRVDTSHGAVLEGELVEVRPTPPALPGFPPRPVRIPVDHIVLLDAAGRPVSPVLPLPVDRVVTVDLLLLTNSVEDRALLIPTSPMGPDLYTFNWAIDRERYRSPVVDDTVRYRANVVMPVTLTPLMS
jgi:hypothetical protein